MDLLAMRCGGLTTALHDEACAKRSIQGTIAELFASGGIYGQILLLGKMTRRIRRWRNLQGGQRESIPLPMANY